ncbi:type VI secretion system tip protein TssI/VgrG [Xenorhabdus budapestensis]|uniref:Type VI secretion system tip protein VgrG n=1 Tax=Xenorhabdus budapestensis TaxID=290110 RepID=A0ABX7VIA0_XENBU|nr:type VI secretion system tip protein VgrG [Xenorhabdus budapestensis]QTL39661.1 type VI secretion system tip protein VgrG [Xenorhabdus budapestensis]
MSLKKSIISQKSRQTGGNSSGGLLFTLTAGSLPPQTFVVTDFALTEGFSQPFQLNIGLASANPSIDFSTVLDHTATLTILQGETEQRSISGMVSSFEQGNTGLHQTTYQMIIRPDLWRTTLRQNSRIFQQRDIVTIVTTILKEHGIRDVVFSLRQPHPEREFCVQYQESDFTFIQRLSAEEGIFYFFECSNGRNTLVFADDAGSVPLGIELPYQPSEQSPTGDVSVSSITNRAQVRPAQVQLKDYTFKNPAWAAEFSQQMKEDNLQKLYYEHYDYPGRFKDEQHGAAFTRYRLEALRNDALIGHGNGYAIAIQPGRLFTLTNHPRGEWNQPWQVISASHTGYQPQALEQEISGSGTTLNSQFSFIRQTQTWRPSPLPKPIVDGPQIAKVVGPAGEEIFCDQYGRVRLQFPWDRYGRSDDQSSCWIRVTHPWAGQGWGMLAIPRVGQEVVVDFLHGDPDQPIVIGRTYHASNIPPGGLPGSKTQMAFRSKTHKGEGYNQMLFEDAKGSEQLALHAQKDMNTIVLNDMNTTVLNDRTTQVKHDHTENIGNNQVISVRKDRIKEVTGEETSTIHGNRQVTVEKKSKLSAKEDISIQSVNGGIQISTGGASITLDKKGNIHITGKNIIINGKEQVQLN